MANHKYDWKETKSKNKKLQVAILSKWDLIKIDPELDEQDIMHRGKRLRITKTNNSYKVTVSFDADGYDVTPDDNYAIPVLNFPPLES